MKKNLIVIPSEMMQKSILLIRGQKVILDRDLAKLYEVETKYLNRQVRRNRERFPPNFMFQVTRNEKKELVTNWHQFELLKHSYRLPYAFTEHGIAMLASVLNSEKAVKISILIINTFIQLRLWISAHKELTEKFSELERKIGVHDEAIRDIVTAIRQMLNPPEPVAPPKPKGPIESNGTGYQRDTLIIPSPELQTSDRRLRTTACH